MGTESNLNIGIITVFLEGSTAAITTIKYEPGLRVDFPEMISRLIPKNGSSEYSDDVDISKPNAAAS